MSCLGTKLRSFAKEHTYYKAAVLYPFYFFTNVITMQDLLEEECTGLEWTSYIMSGAVCQKKLQKGTLQRLLDFLSQA